MDSISLLIKVKKNTLPDSEKKIAEYILTNQGEVIHQTVMDVADATGSSSSAVTRLCKSLGVKNFSELKLLLAKDVFINENDDRTNNVPHSSELKLIEILDKNIISSIHDLEELIDPEHLDQAIKEIKSARYIQAFGDGLSNNIACDFSHKMLQLGLLSGSCNSLQMQAMFANNMCSKDLGVIITHSGCTRSMVEICKILKTHNVKILSITGNVDSPVAKLSDIVLLSPLTEPLYRQGAGSSRITELLIIDILYTLLIKQDYEYFVNKLQETSQLERMVSL